MIREDVLDRDIVTAIEAADESHPHFHEHPQGRVHVHTHDHDGPELVVDHAHSAQTGLPPHEPA